MIRFNARTTRASVNAMWYNIEVLGAAIVGKEPWRTPGLVQIFRLH